MTFYFIRLIYIFPLGKFWVFVSVLSGCMYSIFMEAVQWWFWWTQLFLLKLTFLVGLLIYPFYVNAAIYLVADIYVQAPKKFRVNRRSRSASRAMVLPIHRRACVFTHVFNIQEGHIAFLRRPLLRCGNTIGHHCVRIWNTVRQNLPSFPPPS